MVKPTKDILPLIGAALAGGAELLGGAAAAGGEALAAGAGAAEVGAGAAEGAGAAAGAGEALASGATEGATGGAGAGEVSSGTSTELAGETGGLRNNNFNVSVSQKNDDKQERDDRLAQLDSKYSTGMTTAEARGRKSCTD